MFYNLKLSFIFFLTAFFISSPESPAPKFDIIDYSVKLNINTDIYVPVPFTVRDFVGFKNFLGFFESGSNYNKVNRFGYLGKYQFGRGTLKMYGVRNLSEYRLNPELQEKVFLMNVMRNKWILRREISWYSNRYLNGTYISESGIIAAAHLSGPGNVKKFLRSHCNPDLDKRDANGTSISDYLNIFKDYDLKKIPAIQKPKRN
jgi:hypothetical protein|tara:strand:+ start:9 stop:617 length:609 start_codon:yes stop_codon:yes gene_type:complete